MTFSSILFMIFILGAVWGGFLFCLWLNFKGTSDDEGGDIREET